MCIKNMELQTSQFTQPLYFGCPCLLCNTERFKCSYPVLSRVTCICTQVGCGCQAGESTFHQLEAVWSIKYTIMYLVEVCTA